MKKFIQSILCALPALLFTAGAHATMIVSELTFEGDALITEVTFDADVDWALDLHLPPSDEGVWWDLNYHIGGAITPVGDGCDDCVYPFYKEGTLFADRMLSLDDDIYPALTWLAEFVTGGPYTDTDEDFFYYLNFDNNPDLSGGDIDLFVIFGEGDIFNGLGFGDGLLGVGEGCGDCEILGLNIDFYGGLQLVANDHEVPEPSIIGLLGIGLLGIGVARRMKKSA